MSFGFNKLLKTKQENIQIDYGSLLKINQNEKPQDKFIDYEECLSCQ